MSSPERDVLQFAKELVGPQPRTHSPAFSSRGSSFAQLSGHVRSSRESVNARKILELQNSVVMLRAKFCNSDDRPGRDPARLPSSGDKLTSHSHAVGTGEGVGTSVMFASNARHSHKAMASERDGTRDNLTTHSHTAGTGERIGANANLVTRTRSSHTATTGEGISANVVGSGN